MHPKKKSLIAVILTAGVAIAVATTLSEMPNHLEIAIRTDSDSVHYSINNRNLSLPQMRSIIRKISYVTKGPFAIHVDDRTSFVDVARLIEAIKKEAPQCQYFLTYNDPTNRIQVLYDARVMPEPPHTITVIEVQPGPFINNR